MNSKTFLTHFKGVPLRAMSRDDTIEVVQHYYRLYHSLLEAHQETLQRQGKALIEYR